ncbi:MAG: DUF1848 family protein [Promethearchaeota archaeon]
MPHLNIVKSQIISCSRRTDVPAFLMKWVLERINEGFVDVVNPFNRNQISRVSLKPEDVRCWVWWSKNFKNWIEQYKLNPDIFHSYKGHFFHFTINSPSELEGNINITLKDRLNQLKWLTNIFGNTAVNYRFDPIIFYKKYGKSQILNNLDKFNYIIENVASFGIKEVIFSFATIYSKVLTRMLARGYVPIELSLEKKKQILSDLIDTCTKNDIKMKACCQPDLLEIEGIEQAHCIDANRIEKLIAEPIEKKKDTGQRKDCGCFKSKDIGGYTGIFRCKHNCDYCYASPAKK